jgi:hypothetical protein
MKRRDFITLLGGAAGRLDWPTMISRFIGENHG